MSIPSAEGLSERVDAGDVGEDAQLDLRIVGGEQHVAGRGDEGAADAPAFLGADRDVLQVGVVGGEPSRVGGGHGEGRVHAPGRRVDVLDQRVRVGALELGELAPVEHAGRQVVALRRKLLQNVGAGAVGAGLALAPGLQAHLVEQHLAELLGRADGEGMAREGVNLAFQRLSAAGEVRRERDELTLVDQDAGGFHPGQHGDQRALDPLVHRGEAVGDEARPNDPVEAEREVGVGGSGIPQRLGRHCVDGNLVAPAAEHVGERRGRAVQVKLRQVPERVVVQAAVQHPGGQHGIVHRGGRHAVL